MDASQENILHFILALSFLTHLISAAVGIWDRMRLKPSLLERLTGYTSLSRFEKFEAEVQAELNKIFDRLNHVVGMAYFEKVQADVKGQISLLATTRELNREVEAIDDRITGFHTSFKEAERTNQALFRDLIKHQGGDN